MSEYGIASENLRKLVSGDDSASATDKGDNALFNARGKKIKIIDFIIDFIKNGTISPRYLQKLRRVIFQ